MSPRQIERLEHAARTAMAWDEDAQPPTRRIRNGITWALCVVLAIALVTLIVREG